MKLHFQILFFLLFWFTNQVNPIPVFTNDVIPSFEFSFSKIENLECNKNKGQKFQSI